MYVLRLRSGTVAAVERCWRRDHVGRRVHTVRREIGLGTRLPEFLGVEPGTSRTARALSSAAFQRPRVGTSNTSGPSIVRDIRKPWAARARGLRSLQHRTGAPAER